MSKQTAESPSRTGAEEQGAVQPAPKSPVEKGAGPRDNGAVKQQQKGRTTQLSNEELIALYREMLLIRRFEEKCAEAYSMGKIGGFCHLYIGQEAVAVGAISAIRPDDYVLTSYREHAHAIAKGLSPGSVMAELYGKATGCSKRKC